MKKMTYALEVPYAGNEGKKLSVVRPKFLAANDLRVLALSRNPAGTEAEKRYYAYASGRLEGICGSPAEAIRLIYDQMGVVVGDGQNYIWTRANRGTEALVEMGDGEKAASSDGRLTACLSMMLKQANTSKAAAAKLASGKSAYEILNEETGGRAVDLKGCILNQMLYYVNRGYPVLALTKGNQAELIVGYDIYKNLIIYDALTGENRLMPEEEAEQYYGAYGYPFISWIH